MNSYALLTLLRGQGNHMGLPEITFHYPPQPGREQELFTNAINTLQQYPSIQRFYWTLVEKNNLDRFLGFLQTQMPDSQLVTIPVDIMHAKIGFNICLRINRVIQNSDKERLLDRIMQADIPPHKDALAFSFTYRKRGIEAFGGSLAAKKIEAETRATFSRNLHFYSETNN